MILLLDVGAGLLFSTFKNMSTYDDFVFGPYKFIIRCITSLLVGGGGGGDGSLGKVPPSSTNFSDDAPSSRVS
jgi:hypothetical protein